VEWSRGDGEGRVAATIPPKEGEEASDADDDCGDDCGDEDGDDPAEQAH
jgi:hypothetical protein